MKVLSRFKKGIKKSAALSYNRSALKNCSDSCRMKKLGLCYAENGPETIYPNYIKKLKRHELISPAKLNQFALEQLKSLTIKPEWFRFSVSGSVPPKWRHRSWDKFLVTLISLCRYLISIGCDIHFPVEDAKKANDLRKAFNDAGLRIVVRRTIQSNYRDVLLSKDHTAFVVGVNPYEKLKNKQESKILAQLLRSKGKRTVICPAIIGSAKCGQCIACADSNVDTVLYPLHP